MSQPDTEISFLPQCGFGADINFDTLIKANRFLFRVYTPKERSPFEDDSEPFFVAPRFDDQVARSPVDLPKIRFSEAFIGTYAEVARHMEWTTRTSSPYISTSFSFSWSIWEAVRRYHQGVKKDVEIAVIDATALGGRAATAVQLLQKSSLAERTDQFWRWYRFSEDSQSVLVYGMIPRAAVLTSIPLLQILRRMPSYFLNTDIQTIPGNPLDLVAWNYRLRKQSYRQFCRDMSKSFLDRPIEVQVRDSTAGAVRLALSFLRPFFHQAVQNDFDNAILHLHGLALLISQWPGGSWVVNHPEIRKVIEATILTLAEELREKYSLQQQEITRMQSVVDGLEQSLRYRHNESPLGYISDSGEGRLDSDDVGVDEVDDELTLVVAEIDPALLKLDEVYSSPLSPATFQTPITPPESRRNSLLLSEGGSSRNFVFTPLPEEDSIDSASMIRSFKFPPSSESPVSPPLTPPPHSPLSRPPTLADDAGTLSTSKPLDYARDMDEGVVGTEPSSEQKLVVLDSDDKPLDDNGETVHARKLEVFPTAADEDDSDETEHEPDEDHEAYISSSPLDHWVRIRPHLSSFSSQSSIGSVETLCNPVEFPSKRLSTSSTDSYEFIPPFSSFRSFGLASRTVSFSEPSSRLPLSPVVDVIDPLDIPLPPSPETSSTSLSESSPVSRTSSEDSFSSEMSSWEESPGALVERPPLRMPSSTTPISPLEPSTSQSSQTSSSVSATSSPVAPIPVDLPVPVEGTAFYNRPKHQNTLLYPLIENEETEDDETSSLQSISFTDNATYLVRGFLVGAFITLFLFSTRRRELLVLT